MMWSWCSLAMIMPYYCNSSILNHLYSLSKLKDWRTGSVLMRASRSAAGFLLCAARANLEGDSLTSNLVKE